MRMSDEVSAVLKLRACGWRRKRIAAELGCSRNSVRRWLTEASELGGCEPANRTKALGSLEA